MSYFQDFPNTNFYNQDLGWLIDKYSELLEQYKLLNQQVEDLNGNIISVATEVVNKALQDGLIYIDTEYNPETKILTFRFKEASDL